MKFAIDKADITPSNPCYMAGYNRLLKSTSVLDPIEINSIAFEWENQLFLLGILDSIMLEEDFCTAVKKEVSAQLNIAQERITISAIHTHSAPSFFKMTWEDNIVEEELQSIAKKEMIKSLIRAGQSLTECTVQLERAEIEGLYGNRNIKGGTEDKTVSLFTFFDQNGQRLGALFNIAAHPTILNGKSYALSADLLGQLRIRLKNQLGCLIAVTNGCCGDVSTRFYRKLQGKEELMYTADSIIAQFNAKKKSHPLFSSGLAEAQLEMISHYDAAKNSDWQQLNEKIAQMENGALKEMYQKRQAIRLAMSPYDLKLIAQLRRFGNVLTIILPGDILSGFGMRIKQAFPDFEVLLICYSNTYCNYLVPQEEYGRYFETHNSRLARNEADRFIEAVIQEAKKLTEIQAK